jgi:hypothetical protein
MPRWIKTSLSTLLCLLSIFGSVSQGVRQPIRLGRASALNSTVSSEANLWQYTEMAILHAHDQQIYNSFGSAVAISGDTILVGAYSEYGGEVNPVVFSGAAYVFSPNQGGVDAWGQAAILLASDRQERDAFGASVTIDGDTIVVGAPLEDGGDGDPLNIAGAAYVYSRNQGDPGAWGQVAILRASDRQAGDCFGISVAISGDTLVVGASDKDGGLDNTVPKVGAAYVFSRNQGGPDAWGQVAVLRPSEVHENFWFGGSVSIDENSIVVGASGGPSGAAYVFQRNLGGVDAWGLETALPVSDPQAEDWFGYSVAIHGDTILVGAPQEDGGVGDLLPNAGAAYLFTRNSASPSGWSQAYIFRSADQQAGDYFGYAVDLDANIYVVGANWEDGEAGDPLLDAGAAYIFGRENQGPPALMAILRASDQQAGWKFGSAVAIGGDFVLIGASDIREFVSRTGTAYLFQRTSLKSIYLPAIFYSLPDNNYFLTNHR